MCLRSSLVSVLSCQPYSFVLLSQYKYHTKHMYSWSLSAKSAIVFQCTLPTLSTAQLVRSCSFLAIPFFEVICFKNNPVLIEAEHQCTLSNSTFVTFVCMVTACCGAVLCHCESSFQDSAAHECKWSVVVFFSDDQ